MPKLIDHAERERHLAEAAWRVAVRDGIRGLSVRNVAAEAGLATGSLRRSFPTQATLVAYCMELAARHVRDRMLAVPTQRCIRDSVELQLRQVLPIDQQRRTEMAVFLTIGVAALSDDELRPTYDRVNDELSQACRTFVQRLVDAGEVPDDIDVSGTAAHMHALVDGLALHLVREPSGADTSWAIRLLSDYLDTLTGGGARPATPDTAN